MITKTSCRELTEKIKKMDIHRLLFVSSILKIAFCITFEVNAAEPPKAGPEYKDLRYDEDFSYLGSPERPYVTDLWDPIKWIELGDGWHLTLGGQARLHLESETDKNFGVTRPSQDTFFLQRYFFHADLKHSDGLRFFF